MGAEVFIEQEGQCLRLQSREPLVFEVQIDQSLTRDASRQPPAASRSCIC
jgi:hypothetical protein